MQTSTARRKVKAPPQPLIVIGWRDTELNRQQGLLNKYNYPLPGGFYYWAERDGKIICRPEGPFQSEGQAKNSALGKLKRR